MLSCTVNTCLFLCLRVPIEPNKDIQKLLKPSSSGDLAKELFHHPGGQDEIGLSGHTASLLHIAEKRREYQRKCHEEGATENEKKALSKIHIKSL